MDLINVVAPLHNEENLVDEFLTQVELNLKKLSLKYKIILVDDGSTDNTWHKIWENCSKNKKIIGIKLSKNFGHHQAITAGIHNTDSEWVIVMDSDLQDRPEVIPDLFKKAEEGFDVVFVSRTARPESLWYKILQKTFYFILRLFSGIKFDSSQANFSIINKKVVDAYKLFPEQARFYGSTIQWLGFRKSQIKAKHGKRFIGRPSYTLKKRFKLALDVILAFSDRPLVFASTMGLIIGSLTFIVNIVISIIAIIGNLQLNWWLFILLNCVGTIILLQGLIGVYISKVFSQVKKRPLFIIESQINN